MKCSHTRNKRLEAMAKSLNKVFLIGRLGRDPELKYTASGTPFCRFSIATDESWTDKNSGEKQEKTEWHNIVVWNKLAEICNQYLTKGSLVYLEGSIQTRKWKDASGNDKQMTEIKLADMVMLGSKNGGARGERYERQPGDDQTPPKSWGDADPGAITDDDVPF